MIVRGRSFDEIYFGLLLQINESPQFVCSPRGQKIKENLVTTLVLENPRARLLSSQKRKADYGFAVGEFMWYWTGKQDLESLLYYNKRAAGFSNDGQTVNSAYGYRMRERTIFAGLDEKYGTGGTQWETCVKTLVDDPDSRRAVMLVNLPEDEREAVTTGSKDVPCTLSLQFFIREGKLDLHVLMRSNDIIWGLTYDLFSFTLFQECMLLELQKQEQFKDLQLGTYYHTAGSMHLYERHFDLAKEIVQEYIALNNDDNAVVQEPMLPLQSLACLTELEFVEHCLRNGRDFPSDVVLDCPTTWMADQLKAHRAKRDNEKLVKP